MKLSSRHLLGIDGMTAEEIALILDTAEGFVQISEREIKKVPTLRGKTVVNFFVEPSTRTRSSFELAEKRLSADALNFSANTSSFSKGESLLDTAKNLEAMSPDFIIIRHSEPGSPHFLARHIDAAIVNAGDGAHEHPTQALLDAFTIRKHKGRLDGLRVAIVGDINHSRVVRSNVLLLTLMGADVVVSGPPTLLPREFDAMGCRMTWKVEEALEGADVVMALRVQHERMNAGYFPTTREYALQFGINSTRLKLAKDDAIVMHPGPMNRGVELSGDLADGNRSVILEQVANGVAVRMAVLYLLAGEPARETTA
ncbi:MAG: aspartate carbamoyltransferase catalytic subunit [Acidobacteria bacterium]|uniref:Aspartate carbamoyltransferase n=1 Tax=Candidatus Polarisedimenticola svalbardensis TaxID=2886004 RepID=A0A8J6XVL1_9BACT|nr:aspartate carbamoyltransferase catalytic subunit [Candidatus Polarisedimenticola svalbardensis]